MTQTLTKKIVKYETALENSLKYFGGDELAATTWINKYALRDLEGNLLESSPEDMHHRLARELARIESKYPNPITEETIFDLLDNFKYIIPQGGSMSGMGNDYAISSLSNCFVVGDEGDSYGAILKTDQEIIQICKRRGGVGTDLSNLRPAGTPVTNAARTSSGTISFMNRFSNTVKEVCQAGRRGALMLSISISHPDAEQFIDIKTDLTKVTGANISVKITDEFMKAAEKDDLFLQKFPIDTPKKSLFKGKELKDFDLNKLYDGDKPGTFFRVVRAKVIWDKIVKNAWKVAEPGVLFWDKILSESPADAYADKGFRTVSTNPCAELPLCTYDSCRLFAINLYSYVENPFTDHARFQYNKFSQHVMIAQRLMDDMVDLELEKIDKIIKKIESDPESDEVKYTELTLWKKIRDKAYCGRRTGLGITAEGDMLAALGLKYASDEAKDFCEKIHRRLAIDSYTESIILAGERGPFPIYDYNLDFNSEFCKRMESVMEDEIIKLWRLQGRRNIANLTLAPTGTTSLISQTTSGIEPAFRVAYKRRRKTTDKSKAVFTDKTGEMFEEYNVLHHKFIEWYRINYFITHEEAKEYLANLSEVDLEKIINESPYKNSTANDIDWVDKVDMQGRIQKWIDHSISCTVNIPESSTVELVNEIYLTAWKSGCKGCTIYRDKSRDGVLVDAAQKEKPKVKDRPKVIDAEVLRFSNKSEKWMAFIGVVDGKPWEVFTGRIDDDLGYLPKSVTKGRIERFELDSTDETGEVHHRYDFSYDIPYGYTNTIPDIGNTFNPEYYNYARIVSAMLQEGVHIPKIVAALSKLKCGDTINTWNRGVARALKKFIENGTKSGSKCPHCGADLVYYNGCTTCPGCGRGGKCD